MVTRKTSIISITLLIIAVFVFMPCMDLHAQSTATDINKPTRERVKNKKDTQQEVKQEATPAKKQEATPAKKQETTPAKKQEAAKPAEKQDNAKPTTDSTAKAAAEKPKVRKTTNTETTDFDGIDVSKYQGRINWEELKKNPKIKFVYIKATEGSDYIDPTYMENIRNARRHGFKVGSYHFLSTRSSVVTQFVNFARTVKRDEQDLLPVIDVEKLKPWTSQQLRDSLKVFADLVEDYYGCKPLIYTSEKFFTTNLGRAFADYPLFIAKYSSVAPNIGYKWIIWQFADNGLFKGPVKGNYGEVDLSRFSKGCGINDIIYKPAKGKPKISVKDAVDKNKEKPTTVNLTEQQQQNKAKETPKVSAKQQKEEEQKKAEKAKRASEREKRLAEEEAKKKAKEKAEAEKKAKAKAEQEKREKAREKERQQAKEQKAKKEAEIKAKQREASEQKAKAEQKAKEEAEAKAKRKAAAQKAKQEKSQRNANSKQNKSKSSNLLGSSSTSMSKALQGDSIRNAQYKGRKINKSSADND